MTRRRSPKKGVAAYLEDSRRSNFEAVPRCPDAPDPAHRRLVHGASASSVRGSHRGI